MSQTDKQKRVRLSKLFHELLGRPVSIKHLTADEVAKLVEGYQVMTNGEALAEKVMQLAITGKEWAIQIVLERTEGRAVQATKEDGGDKSTEEKLDHVTTQHLNAIAKRAITPEFFEPDKCEPEPSPENHIKPEPTSIPAGPASKLVGLPKDGPSRS